MAGEVTVSRLDRLIGYLSPARLCTRLFWKEELARNYDAARNDRYGSGWHPSGSLSSEQTDASYRATLRGRARDLERNNSIVIGILDGLERNVIGAGITPQPAVESRSGRPNEALNRRIAALWADWSRKEHCDVSGTFDYRELQRLYLRRMIVDGDIFMLITAPSQGYPIAVQAVEADLLAEDLIRCGSNYVFGGVEVDGYMKPVAFHFRLNPVADFRTVRIPAERIIHGFRKTRCPQTRGVSSLAGCMEQLRDIGEYMDSELKAARIAASITGIVSTESGAARIGRMPVRRDANGTPIEAITPGVMHYMKPGEGVSFPQPGRPNVNASAFIATIMRQIGVGLGLSYEAVSRDLSQVNYSSIREGRLQDIKTYEEYQRDLIETFCRPLYRAWMDAMVSGGYLTIPGYWSDREKYQHVRWVRPGWSWVDPQKEANAAEKSLQLGTTTLQEVCGYEGKDWQEVLRQRKAEQDFIENLGVKVGENTGISEGTSGGTADEGAGASSNGAVSVAGGDSSEGSAG